jgi:hypothetical protein
MTLSKNKSPNPSDADDYLNQLHWKSKNAYRRTPWYLIPRRKYKPVIRIEHPNPDFLTGLIVGIFIFLTGFLIYSSIIGHSGLSIFILVIVLIIAMILFFATRDAQKILNDDNDRSHSERK